MEWVERRQKREMMQFPLNSRLNRLETSSIPFASFAQPPPY